MFTYKLVQVDENNNVIDEFKLYKESRENNLRYLNVWFNGVVYTEDECLSFIIYVYDNNVQIAKYEFELSDMDDYIKPSKRGRINLCQCMCDNKYIICDFELLDMPKGIYRVDGSFEPCNFDFKEAKKALNNVRLEFISVNNYYGLLMDQNGLQKGLKQNETFWNYVGDIVVVEKID